MQTKLAALLGEGRWRLDRRLGHGADGELWAATDLRAGRPVALKLLHAALDEAARERLRWEFALLAAIEHPHLVRVFDLDSVDGRPFYTSELLAGAQPTRLTALPPPERARALCQLLAEVASALAALHQRGLVHHDVKPANLLVDDAGRTRLGDLGLAARLDGGAAARGTPAYLAPEAFFGSSDPRVDLYALGASAYELWSGHPPFVADSLGELLRRAQTTRPAPLADAPAGLQRLLERLLALDPAARPSSARAVVDEARRLGARLEGALDSGRAPILLCRPLLAGRAAELAALTAALATARLVLVEGAPGSGRSRLIEEARRAQQLDEVARGRAATPWWTLGDEPPARLCARLAATAVRLHVARVEEPRVEELLTMVAHGAAAPSVVLAEIEPGALPALDGEGVVRVPLPRLDEPAVARLVASMLGAPDDELARAVERAGGGLPRVAVALVRAAVAAGPPYANQVGRLEGQGLSALLAATLHELSRPARALVDAAAVLGQAAPLPAVAALAEMPVDVAYAAALAARAAGAIELDAAGRVQFPSSAHAAAAYAALGPRRRPALHRRALAAAGDDAVARARHLVALADPGAGAAAVIAGERLLERGQARAALRLLADAAERAPLTPAARLVQARAEVQTGDYRAALATLAPVAADGDALQRLDAALVGARALQRAGELAAAEARLRPILAAGAVAGTTPRSRDEARGLLGRVLIARGAYAEAAAACASSELPSAAVAEARGLGCFYLGRFDEADAAFAAVEADAAADPAALARARSLRGMVAHGRDQLAEATALYQSALELARAADDLHGAAVYAANLGAVLREQAEYERALPPTADAARDLGRLGQRAERAFALFNYGNLLLSIGDLDGAERAAGEAAAWARAAAASRELGYAQLLAGDLARRHGDRSAAVAAYRAGAATLAGAAPRDRLQAALNLAEALAEAGDPVAGQAALSDARTLAAAANEVDSVPATAARVALQLGEPLAGALVAELARLRAHAAASGRRELAFRADVILARAHIRTGALAAARTSLTRAQATWEEIRMRTPELSRDAAAEDADVRRLRQLVAAAAEAPLAAPPSSAAPLPSAVAAPGWSSLGEPATAARTAAATPDAAALRRLLAINKRLNSEQRLPVLLDLILDTVLELTSAERGFVLITDGAGEWQIKAARNIAAEQLDASAFSRSIAERAAREAMPIVTLDASGDRRFEAALSVSDLKLRSVLAVPLAVKGHVVGCVYADHRLRAAAFGDAEVALVCDLAEQAAIAVENARLLAENERRRKAIDELNRELERKVASQALELGELHKEVRTSRAALSLRYNYDNLVGRTPRMLELFRLLDRVTETALPVVIYGESGTGKELVARAIHHNGPRRARAFVSESCAAIPETLLEAALFGHVRGAFTGADADRRGLFEIADGGTLFLDEVGEMSPAMQAKLLRVLQAGEFRRVGGEKSHKVDVRVLVASNRDLGRLVEQGRFREDLFYRLNVVRVALPPLRERRDDIPLLVEHFLKKFAEENKRPPRRIARAALHKLIGYRWPGNVRELENEVVRAASLGGEVIAVDDLSPPVAAGEPAAAVDSPDDLALKQRVERLERTLVREALHRAGGNQTQAARLLGLSRFGLQKKLRRYQLDG